MASWLHLRLNTPIPSSIKFGATPPPIPAAGSVSVAMANSIRVAAAQMTSVNDLATNFATCSRLVKISIQNAMVAYWLPTSVSKNEVSNTRRFAKGYPFAAAASAGAKLLCFPENFSYVGAKQGDSLKIAEPLDGPILRGYCSLARESSIWLSLGGFQEKGCDDAHLRNTHVLIDDAGNIRSTYSKMHLFDVDVPGGAVYKESSFTEPGKSLAFLNAILNLLFCNKNSRKDIAVVDSPFGRIGLTVCYDLRFPDLYQHLRFYHDAQVLLIPAAFTTATGQAHWEILLRARAIETQCYVIAAAQAGKHSEKRESYGDTLIIDPWGTIVGRLPDRSSTGITVADIDFSLIDSIRAKMPLSVFVLCYLSI
nr:nitrilase-like protein 2 [Ipomoea batatas]